MISLKHIIFEGPYYSERANCVEAFKEQIKGELLVSVDLYADYWVRANEDGYVNMKGLRAWENSLKDEIMLVYLRPLIESSEFSAKKGMVFIDRELLLYDAYFKSTILSYIKITDEKNTPRQNAFLIKFALNQIFQEDIQKDYYNNSGNNEDEVVANSDFEIYKDMELIHKGVRK